MHSNPVACVRVGAAQEGSKGESSSASNSSAGASASGGSHGQTTGFKRTIRQSRQGPQPAGPRTEPVIQDAGHADGGVQVSREPGCQRFYGQVAPLPAHAEETASLWQVGSNGCACS